MWRGVLQITIAFFFFLHFVQILQSICQTPQSCIHLPCLVMQNMLRSLSSPKAGYPVPCHPCLPTSSVGPDIAKPVNAMCTSHVQAGATLDVFSRIWQWEQTKLVNYIQGFRCSILTGSFSILSVQSECHPQGGIGKIQYGSLPSLVKPRSCNTGGRAGVFQKILLAILVLV